ncbi:MAG: YbbR family protein [Paenibacillaceae bacterium]|jgi:YbbR domain-containing protein|nr:YbbR family protein [Paenibacillaceae bacterium]
MDKWLRNTNVVRIVALAIGVLLWVVVHLDVKTNTESSVRTTPNATISNVMVQALYDEIQYSIVSIQPSEVTVTLKGDDNRIREMNPGNFKIIADLSKLTAGTYDLEVAAESELPRGVTLEIVPNKVQVVMEEKKMKEIPVQIDVTGKPADGYRTGTPILNPGRVYISGPASKIEMAETARATVNIDEAKQNVFHKVKLIAYDKFGNEVKGAISPPVLEVEVPITLPLKPLPLQIKWKGQPAAGYAIAGVQQSVEQIIVYGTQDVLDKMDFYEGVELDITDLREDKVFSVEVPVNNQAVKVEPSKLEIKVTVVPAVTKVLEGIPIRLGVSNEGVDSRLVAPENGTTSITVEGAPAVIDKLRSQDVQAQVNVSNLAPGTHELAINVSLPPFVKRLDGVARATVEVTTRIRPSSALPSGSPAAPSPTPTPLPSLTPLPSPPADVPADASVAPSATPASSPEASASPPVVTEQ